MWMYDREFTIFHQQCREKSMEMGPYGVLKRDGVMDQL